jgi:hypothetical protein
MQRFKKWSLWESKEMDTPCRQHGQLLNVVRIVTIVLQRAEVTGIHSTALHWVHVCHIQSSQSVGERPPLQRAPEDWNCGTNNSDWQRKGGVYILNVIGKLKDVHLHYSTLQSVYAATARVWQSETHSIQTHYINLMAAPAYSQSNHNTYHRNKKFRESESYATTDSQSASLSWNKAPIWGLRQDFYYCQTVASLLMWGDLSDERMGVSFTIAAGARQRSHSRTRNHILPSQIRDSLFVVSYGSQGYGGCIRHLFLVRHGPHRKRRVQQFFYCCVYSLPL